MTKKVNRIYLIIAIAFILISIMIPVVDYFVSKSIIFSKVEGLTANEMQQFASFYESEMSSGGFVTYYSFYVYFGAEYANINMNSAMYKAIEELLDSNFNTMIVWNPYTSTETYFIWYILDKVLWLFVAYCIFVIPISMVDLFYKMMKREVD